MRICTPNDVPWLMELSQKHYKSLKNLHETREWFLRCISSPNYIVLRTDEAFALAVFERSFYDSKIRGDIILFAGNIFPLVRIMKKLKEIGQSNGISWSFSSSTDWKIEKLAKILGARQLPTYIMGADNV